MKASIFTTILGLSSANVFMHVNTWGSEITWLIKDTAGVTIPGCSGGPYPNHVEVQVPDCNPGNSAWTLECHDDAYDGWHNGFISINGQHHCGDYNTFSRHFFSYNNG
tara:strand:- start:171 stop:494 length:324 start_codon:yes stop_codon:yes gene_type:complete